MMDSHFKRATILLCEHHSTGSIGFIMNKSLQMNIGDLVSDFPDFESEVHFGGPVGTDTIHFIHNLGDLIEESVEVAPGVFWGGSFDQVKFMIKSSMVTEHNIRFFVGYTGWGSGQLAEELREGTWLMAEMDPNYLFKEKPESLWRLIMEHKGNNFTAIAGIPDTTIWN